MENYEIIEIGDKKFPVSFGFAALRNYSTMTGTTLADLNKLGTNMTLDDALVLMWCGIKDGHRRAKIEGEFTLDVDDVADLIDGNIGCLEQVFEVLSNQMTGNTQAGGKKTKAKKLKK